MHKLGAALGVKGMSLYRHIANKEDLLDGVVEVLWDEVEVEASAQPDWREGLRSFANSLRSMVLRHPNAANLLLSQRMMPESALRVVRTHIEAIAAAGYSDDRASELARTITSYALGSSLAETAWDVRCAGCTPDDVRELLRPGTPDDLVTVAEIFCGRSDSDAEFELGLDLMLRGIDEPSGASQ